MRLEVLESRTLLSVAGPVPESTPHFDYVLSNPAALRAPATGGELGTGDSSPTGLGFTPAQIDAAYGFTSINYGSLTGSGAGQTIAIIDAYNDPDIVSDAATFNTAFGLPSFNTGGPTLTVLNQSGGTSLRHVTASGTSGWATEESLERRVGACHCAAGQHRVDRGQHQFYFFLAHRSGRSADDYASGVRGLNELEFRRRVQQ